MNSKQANISANFEKQILNLLKKNKLPGFKSNPAMREAMLGGGVGGAVGLADAMREDGNGNIEEGDKASKYLKSILGYGAAGAGIGGGVGLRKGLKLQHRAAKSELAKLLPGIEKELSTGVNPTLMGEARSRVLGELEKNHPGLDYETFMENLAKEKSQASKVPDKKPGFFERRDIARESEKANKNYTEGRAAKTKADEAQAKADKAMSDLEAKIAPKKRTDEEIIAERLREQPGSSAAPRPGVAKAVRGKPTPGGVSSFERLDPKAKAPVAPIAPPENHFVKMYREGKDALQKHQELFNSDPTNRVHLANVVAVNNHLKDIETFTHTMNSGDLRKAQPLHDRIIKRHASLTGGQNPLTASANPISGAAAPANKPKPFEDFLTNRKNKANPPAETIAGEASSAIPSPTEEKVDLRDYFPVNKADNEATYGSSPRRREKMKPSDASAADARAQAANPPLTDQENADRLNMSLAKYLAMMAKAPTV